jgi:hypothetical protein
MMPLSGAEEPTTRDVSEHADSEQQQNCPAERRRARLEERAAADCDQSDRVGERIRQHIERIGN